MITDLYIYIDEFGDIQSSKSIEPFGVSFVGGLKSDLVNLSDEHTKSFPEEIHLMKNPHHIKSRIVVKASDIFSQYNNLCAGSIIFPDGKYQEKAFNTIAPKMSVPPNEEMKKYIDLINRYTTAYSSIVPIAFFTTYSKIEYLIPKTACIRFNICFGVVGDEKTYRERVAPIASVVKKSLETTYLKLRHFGKMHHPYAIQFFAVHKRMRYCPMEYADIVAHSSKLALRYDQGDFANDQTTSKHVLNIIKNVLKITQSSFQANNKKLRYLRPGMLLQEFDEDFERFLEK